ncbi:kinase-like domain-containing protein [Dichotomopilus funicola]|uniref:Kinase-like domain-containing protein n=1 Tax=Dichotomopilus funicola TaxID=1934379 RepID=A0AAN6ZLF3_9PEZI|nr:kinase-like domain-containing protein [Dichotomopilus funicola]
MAPSPPGMLRRLIFCLLQGSQDDENESFKKPRRSERISSQRATAATDNDNHVLLKTPVQNKHQLPSPLTHLASESTAGLDKDVAATPPQERPSQVARRRADEGFSQGVLSSPPQDTQAFSQQDFDPNAPLVEGIDELKEGVWGYLLPLDSQFVRSPVVLKKKGTCSPPSDTTDPAAPVVAKNGGSKAQKGPGKKAKKDDSATSGGYLLGRHPECDIRVDDQGVSNRHCIIFMENKGNGTTVVIEDLSLNGTFINGGRLHRNDRRELQEGDEISVTTASAGFIFRYPRCRHGQPFAKEYTIKQQLGSGHFADVFLCNERSTGDAYAVKRFTKRQDEDKSKYEGLHQEVAMLMGISHSNVLCLKETFNEAEAVYVVLELAPNGELFTYITENQKLTEGEARKVFLQLFEGMKYLHDRNMVHRDIKPENILLMDNDLTVKIGDFGLAKIVGETSFTTTLCGTPSYVAPEILVNNRSRKYTKAVDVWSLGVVLYICLCGFPPFSDELRRPDFPYDLSAQIQRALYDYPSPYWDSVSDEALDLIDHMFILNPDQRYTIDQCLAHPWMTQRSLGVNDSTNGLVSGLAGLEMSRRAPHRERTMLSSINTCTVTERVPAGAGRPDVKVYAKNAKTKAGAAATSPTPKREARPDDNRDPGEFMEMGGRGDQELYGNDGASRYPTKDIGGEVVGTEGKVKGKVKGNKGGR